MKKKYEELFERLKKERGAALFDEDGCLKWNSIDYTQRSWLEVPRKGEPPLYLERDDGLNVLAVDAAVPDLMDEYGENHFPEEAEEDERLVSKATLEARHGDDYDFDSYVNEKFGLKTEAEIREDLERPVQGVLAQSPEGNALAKMKIKTLGDLLLADPAETEDKLASMGASASIFLRLSYWAESFGYDWGSGLADAALELAKEEWKASYLKAASDGLIDPAETWALRDLAERLSLDSDDCAKIEEECLPSLGGKKPLKSVWLATRAEGFSGWFERNKFEAAKSFAAENGGFIPAFGDVSAAADTLVRTLMYGGKSAHACYGANKFWIEDNETREVKEASLPEIAALAERIAEENEQPLHKEIIASAFRPKEVLLPVDVRYSFNIPKSAAANYQAADYKERPEAVSLRAIRGCFQWPSEVVEFNDQYLEESYTIRHYIAVSNETDYSNLNYAEIEDKLQALVGAALNEAFGTNKEILFREVKAFRPERFVSPLNDGKVYVVNEKNAKIFAMTPEEFSLSLNLEEVKKSGGTVAERVKGFMSSKAEYEAILEENPALKKWAESVVQEEKKKTVKPAMKVFNVIPKEQWNEGARKNPDKMPEAMSDVYQIEADRSGQSGILHFPHELHLSFDLDDSGNPRFLLGDEIASEDIEYNKDDWNYIKERFPGIENEVKPAIENFFIKNDVKESAMESKSDELDNKVARAGMHILRESGLDELDSDDYWYARDAVEDAVRAFYEHTSLSVKGKHYEVGEDHGAISDYLTDVLFNGAGPRVVKSAEDPSELIDSLREAFANELDISFPSERFYVQPEGDKFARTVEDVPVWAVPYLACGESDSLTEEDKKLADEFMESHGFGKLIDASNTYSERKYFRSHPAFGPACDCVDANFTLKEAEREIKDSKEIEFRSKEEIFEDFVKRVKDDLSGADRKAVSAVLSAAKAALASFPDGEKTAIGEFLSKKGAKDEESLKKILGSTGRKEKSAGRGRKPPEMSR